MKITSTLLLTGMMATFCCSIVSAQIIYSNDFTSGEAVTLNGVAPTVANNYAGGTNTAHWFFVTTNNDDELLANGVINASTRNSVLLPFTPQPGSYYFMTASVNEVPVGGAWQGIGFAQSGPTNLNDTGASRFTDNPPNGYAWMSYRVGDQCQLWTGAGAHNPASGQLNMMPSPGLYTVEVMLNTMDASHWTVSAFINGVQVGTNYTYAANPPIAFAGITMQSGITPGSQWYNYWALSTALVPIITQQPTSQSVGTGNAYTNTVTAIANTSGGPLYYQWFTNDVSITGATTNSELIINPVSASDACTNIYVVITNNYGAVTSAVTSLTVEAAPVFSAIIPTTYTNPMTLFGGTNVEGTNYVGSSPTFSVSVIGGQPITYQWLTNGVTVVGATGDSLALTNCQLNSPTNFTCIVTNNYGKLTNVWSVSYLPTPMASYPQAVLADQPVGFWRLNEGPDDGYGDNGIICNDYQSGNNGIYTNVNLDQGGYNPFEPMERSVLFGETGLSFYDSYAGQIQGVDFATADGANAEFTVAAWVNGYSGAQVGGGTIIGKGVSGVNDEFNLGLNASKCYQFYVRSADGTVYTATNNLAPDSNWHYLVGVCDEANGRVSLYVDGVLLGSTAIPANSGLYETSEPMSIGSGITSGTGQDYTQQFFGFIDDVAAFNYALTSGQVANLYTAVGSSIGFTFVSPLPPTNDIFQANGTITIPATVFAQPPVGYYWTNLTTGTVIASGSTNVFGNLDATLTIPNAPASLSGDQLELVITNATDSTNWFVTLFSPAPPVTLDYSSPILYSNYFNGGTWSIDGMPLTAANALVGGTNAAWVDALGTNDTAGVMQANGIATTTLPDSWVLPFTPRAGYVYTTTASLTFSGNPGSWIGLGFAQRVPTNAAVGYGRFSDGGATPPKQGPNGYDWIILTEGNGKVQYFAGPGGSPPAGLTNAALFTAGTGTHTVQVVLDTTGNQWVQYAFVDGVSAGTNTYASNPPIGAVGITHNITAPQYVQWNSFSLTQVAPNGVPPYTFESLPASVTLEADTPLSIPATAFGSAPFGYYWSNTNTAAVLGLNSTGDMAPLNADLNVADVPGSWNGNTLALVVTNAYGTNISLVSLTVTNAVSLTPTNIVVTMTNNNLYLTWPIDHKGYTLQVQTNALSVGLSTNWVDVSGSTTTNQVVVPVDMNNGSVFYRLIYP